MAQGLAQTVDFNGVDEFNVKAFSERENEVFYSEWPTLVSMFTKYGGGSHKIADIYNEFSEEIRFFGQLCKNEIQPSPGAFEGMYPKSGFGWTNIRPGYLCPTEQGSGAVVTFDTAFSGTANTWYGLYHHAAIGGAYNADPLFLRKELGAVIIGQIEMMNPLIEEMQWEIEQTKKPILNMLLQMRGTDLQMFKYPKAIMLRPAKEYRSQAKYSAAGGNICPVPLGVAFVASDYMKNTAVTQPDKTAP